MATWATCFGLGKFVKSGSTPNLLYTCTPLIPANCDGTEAASSSLHSDHDLFRATAVPNLLSARLNLQTPVRSAR